ncbi:hypothetical protein H2203_007968 [Taxawa tesnikishii (nom. ined.)]|nr:hypothetical protein H2203_007968 [Dothideales sp. JES 119]
MRFSTCAAFAAGLLGAASAHPASASTTCTPTRTSTHTSTATSYSTKAAYSICKSKAAFATVDGRLFDFNGTRAGPRYFAGTNTWWLSHILNDSDVDRVLSEIKGTQLQVTRVWGFGSVNSDPGPGTVFFQQLNSNGTQTINWAPNGIPRLDSVVAHAEKYNVKLVLNFVNNWGDLGGIASYTTAFGGNATTWYTDATSQKIYRDYIKLLLANEPRCHGCPTSTIYNWATEISQYIKGLDPRHMVTLGDEGWFAPADNIGDGSYAYSGAEGVDFVKNLGIKTLDYGTFHLYPDSWGYNETWGSTWIVEHDKVGAAAGKPVVLEEYGGPPSPHNHTGVEAPWQQTVLKDTSIAMDQFWQFGDPSPDTVNLGDPYSIYINDTEYQILARDHAAAMLEKAPIAKQ